MLFNQILCHQFFNCFPAKQIKLSNHFFGLCDCFPRSIFYAPIFYSCVSKVSVSKKGVLVFQNYLQTKTICREKHFLKANDSPLFCGKINEKSSLKNIFGFYAIVFDLRFMQLLFYSRVMRLHFYLIFFAVQFLDLAQ